MSDTDHGIQPGSATDLALQRALEGANLRAGDSLGASNVSSAEVREPSAAESGDAGAGFDGDGD